MIRASRVGLVHGAFLLFAAALVVRAAKVQLFETSAWRDKARQQQVAATPIVPAPRGMILDAIGRAARGKPPALSSERRAARGRPAHARAAPGTPARAAWTSSSRARSRTRACLTRVGGARATDTTRVWVTVPGRFLAADVGAILAMRGSHSEAIMERVPPATDGLRRLIGRADDAGEPVDGMEKALDPLPCAANLVTFAHDAMRPGHRFDSPGITGNAARPGHTVTLTINQTLQDIAERALGDAVHQMGASGGDIVMLDPATSEIRAMASRRADPLSMAATALTEPYEPGSTLKPFVAARLLDLHRARVDEVMNTYNGKWELNGRQIVDDHRAPAFSLADVIRFSSNIGIVQFAERFSPREQYELLRDLGFGVPTGLPYPAEESGRLPSPGNWDKQTPASLAMGYALNVTPLQLANAYGAIANGGELLQPAIVKEIRAPDGTVIYRHQRQVVRRVMSAEIARTVRGLLRGVVESGTGDSAKLATFDVAGKTGTAKRAEHGKYVAGKYTASFVGLFPADAPQLVILVKLDNPAKSIYGGKAAAPVSKTVLLAAIAARDASLDRRELAATPARAARAGPAIVEHADRADSLVRVTEAGSVPYVYRLDAPVVASPPVLVARAVPDVRGMPVRGAVYTLHRAGFRVSVVGSGDRGVSSVPPAGAVASAGSTVRLVRAP